MKKKDNKSLNMQINDDGCIRYLMKEMDPSEEIEFEREMMKDEDLLIEVETLRKSFQKLGKTNYSMMLFIIQLKRIF